MTRSAGVPPWGLTVNEWLEAYRERRFEPTVLFDVLAGLDANDPAWICRVDVAELSRQLVELAKLGGPEQLELFGVPYAVKDNIDVAGLPTTASCPAYSYLAEADAEVVARLRRAGAIVLGKTNLDQFATGLVGVRSPYGIVPSAFDATRIGGGSSSGSASVVSRGLVPFALGTDTAGSGRVPAAFQNIVGIKPTLGRFSTRGVVPACRSLDCVSIFSLTVDDGARVARLLHGFDESCAESRRAPPAALRRSTRHLAVPAELEFCGDELAQQAFQSNLLALTELGFSLTPIDFTPFRSLARLLYEGPWVAERLLVIEELLARDPEAIHPVVRGIVEKGREFSAADAFRFAYQRGELARAMDRELQSVEALVVPTTPTTFTIAEVLADPLRTNSLLGTYTNFTNLGDLSALSLGGRFRADGLPAGITLLAPAFRDESLVELAREISAHLALPLGATGRAWTAKFAAAEAPSTPLSSPDSSADEGTLLAVVGAHLSGLSLNHQLTSRGATLVEHTHTAPRYRLYVLPNTTPAKPGLLRVAVGQRIEVEVWSVPNENVAAFLGDVPPPLAIGSLELESGTWVKGFVAEPCAFEDAEDITAYGGFRAWLEARG